jgi:hypothetical protein
MADRAGGVARYDGAMGMRIGRFLVVTSALAALLAGGCSSSTATPSGASGSGTSGASSTDVQKAIGPEGGTIEVGGAVVTFPKGAVAQTTMITISVQPASTAPAGFVSLSSLFKCEPAGTTFAQPVEMRMPFTDDGKGGTLMWSTGADPTFNDLGGHAEGAIMVATVQHFSAGFVGRKN